MTELGSSENTAKADNSEKSADKMDVAPCPEELPESKGITNDLNKVKNYWIISIFLDFCFILEHYSNKFYFSGKRLFKPRNSIGKFFKCEVIWSAEGFHFDNAEKGPTLQ